MSIIIVNWNGIQYLDKCLTSVLNTNFRSFEVVFVDNGSVDGSVEFVRRNFGHDKRMAIIENKKNLGFAEGTNVGIRNAVGKYVAFLNNDMEVETAWLEEIIKVMEHNLLIGAAQGKLLLANPRNYLDSVGGLIDYHGYSYARGSNQEDKGQYDKIRDIFYANAAVVRRQALDRIDMLDPDFFLYYEETDLCWRLWLSGYRVVCVPSSRLYHVRGATVSKHQLPMDYFAARNRIAMLIKNYQRKNMVKFVAELLAIETRKAILSATLSHDCRRIITLSKAIFWNLVKLRRTWKKRQIVQRQTRQISDLYLMHNVMAEPYPPFPHCLIFTSRYLKGWKWRRFG